MNDRFCMGLSPDQNETGRPVERQPVSAAMHYAWVTPVKQDVDLANWTNLAAAPVWPTLPASAIDDSAPRPIDP
jgi:hypothetical protein